MKTNNMTLTISAVLGVMQPGCQYTASRLAARLGAPLSSVRLLLTSDAALARLDVRNSHHGRKYSIAGSCSVPGGHVDTRVRPDFTSHLTGYVSGIERHRALAMSTRGVR